MKKAFLLFTALTFACVSLAANNQPIEETFQRYWGAYSKKDFAKAAADVLPSDLDDVKAALLPVFLEAQGHRNKEVQELVTAFFGRTVGKARESLSPVDVFSAINRIVVANDPNMFEVLKDASTSIIFVRRPKDDEAEVHFQIMHRGASDIDTEALIRKSGRWWIRFNEDPKQMAAQFKQMFAEKK